MNAQNGSRQDRPGAAQRAQVLDRIHDHGIVAVIRAGSADSALRCAVAVVAGGVGAIEITYTTPDAASAVKALRREFGSEVVVGAGTLTALPQVEEAADAGAEFLVSPGVRPLLASAMTETGLTTLMGVLTPSEVLLAGEHRADAVKIFPGNLGGPAFLSALRGPFPELRAVPTGGVDSNNLAAWFEAGAWAVGVGGELCPRPLIDRGDWSEITRRARLHAAALERVPSR
ncbi:2-keto-3-deoxy-phosphogluconate aldolase [Nakamurella panacisegetis]|uniref:2-keto-3-deoxy-phosphogluconate aldolase n=1 Tax=Nakamurella panacisegetis TaxID=1090615 RepID=A0A1H0RA18_9ACTN|nr:bifunctional 4-hydroxy-2-oxoglutarate aldolase/2-dehydro-3-deoxy-phosphogluconate aldolase [Nakamurella panacisegetis]SDP25856.1 2-keto-3-deoxy-phosphogluconate aldolase [Nakamurella panacisegetis]